ncbi:hypothetical protein OT109_07560 [Phycisphaeraceae bacterium D3-23]
MTQPYIDAGELVVIGLVQEQHPERAQLYAQWRELDWPILWDPFNTTGATAVPNAYLIDEHGILQGKRLNEDSLAAFMAAAFEAPAIEPIAAASADGLVRPSIRNMSEDEAYYWNAISNMNWSVTGRQPVAGGLGSGSRRNMQIPAISDAIAEALNYPEEERRRAYEYFRLGVLYRMRHDSEHRQGGDFQAAIDAWEHALELDPNQYIWRRRIQQYGPMSDKPYPFYDWVATAQREITERGEVPVAIPQALTQAELGTEGSALVPEGEPVNPDPDGRITADDTGIITVTAASTPDTQTPGSRRVLVEFATSNAGHWNNEAEPLTVWINADDLPDGWSVESPLLIHAPGHAVEQASSDEPRIIDFGLTHPADAAGAFTLTGYALYNVCEADDLGRCLYRRQAFEVVIELE